MPQTHVLFHTDLCRKYSDEIQKLYGRRMLCEVGSDEAKTIEIEIQEKIVDALLDWELGRAELRGLGRIIAVCEGRECPPDPEPDRTAIC